MGASASWWEDRWAVQVGHPEHEVSGFQGSWFCEEFNNHIMRMYNKSRKQCTRKTFILHLRRISPVRCDTTRGCWHLREYRIISEALARGTITMLTDIPKEPLSERPLDIELERPSDKELERRSET